LTRLGTSADIRTSDDVDSPVTIGLRHPLILLPARALALPLPVQQAIVCHELIHVRRRDWAHIVFEQVWCGLLWFHPAAHLLVSRTSLMREALVDRETLAVTRDRRAYAHALLAFAEPTARVPVAVPSLIRARHLSRRIALITQETPMSHRHIAAALVVGLATVSAATATSMSRFPIMRSSSDEAPTLAAADQTQDIPVRPGDGVSVPRVVKEVRPTYTPAALQAKIQGDVELDVVVLANGDPGEIVISRSLDTVHGLDDAAMQAAAQWKFEPGRRDGQAVPVVITVQMTFRLR
jgi:TonB family protein